jgi:hypothetical protein
MTASIFNLGATYGELRASSASARVSSRPPPREWREHRGCAEVDASRELGGVERDRTTDVLVAKRLNVDLLIAPEQVHTRY